MEECTEVQVTFPVGDISLEGLYSTPQNTPQIGAVLCHPHPLYGGEMRNNVVSALTDTFQKADIATLRFNFRGVGQSGGQHGEGEAELEDVKGAVTALLDRQAVSHVVVAGYSFGSMVGLRAGANDERVQTLIGVAFPMGFRDPSFLLDVAKPTLLISGDRDEYAPLPDLTDFFSKMLEPKQLEIIAGADHFFMVQAGEVAKAALAFLQAK